MKHVFYCDGNQKKIAWVIQTDGNAIEQLRDHADIYLDKITDEQSRFIALHVGVFWGIGRFIIKNNDTVSIMMDSKSMFEHLNGDKQSDDSFIQNRSVFISQIVEQRKLNIECQLIDVKDNLAHKLLG
ncbi:MAG: hypothetical protein Q8O65_03760 [Nitrosopumilaceae archaeon]|nr:hypothetical protein [Nitrosopumilaceae archaeon]